MNNNIYDIKNLYAWCIVPFDIVKRNPSERIAMLKELGFNSYGYDWREEHINEMEKEFNLAVKNDIEIKCVWMWIDANADSVNKLSYLNERVLQNISNTGLRTNIWLGFHENFFEDLNHEESLRKAALTAEYIYRKAESIGCGLAFYNHGGWLGNPENQISIIEKLGLDNIGIVYNFHHGHEYIDEFPDLLEKMMPYLIAVNINGMNREGPKILKVGAGEMDMEMLNELYLSGYQGPVGILCHFENRDAKEVLLENLIGLQKINAEILKAE